MPVSNYNAINIYQTKGMVSTDNSKFQLVTFTDISICEGAKSFLHDYKDRVKTIEPDQLKQRSMQEEIVEHGAPVLMDYSIFSLLWQDDTFRFEDLPAVVLFLTEEEIEYLQGQKLPDNLSFIHLPIGKAALELSLYHSLNKAGSLKKSNLEEERYRSLFYKSSQAMMLLDPKSHKIVEVNKSTEELFDLPTSKLINAGLETLHPDKTESINQELTRVTKGNHAFLNLKYQRGEDVRDLEYFVSSVKVEQRKWLYINVQDITEREKADQMFYQQHEMLRSTLESIDDLFFTLNKDGDFIDYYQPSGSSHLALSSDVFVGKNIYDVGFPLDVAKKYIQTIEQVIDEDKSEQIDYYLEAFGSRLWYSAKISPRKNAFGVAEGVTVLCRDITRQKRTEETLKRARDFYLTLLADFPSMIWKTNTSKRADYFNKTWLDFTGNKLEEELKTDWVEKLHIADVSNFLATLLNAYLKKEPFQIEHRLKHKSGEYRWVINAGRPFYNLEGQFAGFIGSCYDITERRQAEELLNLQKSAMESALEGIIIIEDDDERYPVTYANKELTNITGISGDEIPGMDFLDVIGCPLSPETRSSIIYALKNKKSFKGEIECHNGKQQKSWRLLYMAPVQDEKSSVNHFVAVLSDITEAKEVENALRDNNRQLKKTNEELDRFVYSTSHELRSPLMSVLGLLNLMESEPDNGDRSNYLQMIRDTISRLDKIIHDIIDYSRNSRMDVIYENIDFEGFIQKSITNHAYFDQFEKVKFDVDVKNGVPFFSDKKRIEIIFNNFISNCLRFHNYEQIEPYVRIKVKTSPVNVLITISDNGTGIHEKHIHKIYEMFYRGTEKSTGSGIGLYIVKEIIDKLKGNIQIQSDPGKGTTFIIDIPNYPGNEPRLFSLNSVEDQNYL